MLRWKSLPKIYKSQTLQRNGTKHHNRYQQRLLLDETANTHKHLKQLNKQSDYETNIPNNNITWMRHFAFKQYTRKGSTTYT